MPVAASPRAPLYVVAAATLWGTTGTAQALGPDGASSVAVGATRNVVGAMVLVAVAALRGRLRDGARELERRPLVLAALATAAYQLCFFGGVRLAGVAIGTVVGVGSGPVWGGLVGWIGRGERPGRRWAVATALALSGAALLATTTSDGETVDPLGIVLALGAGLTYALFTLWSKELTDRHDPDLVMTWVFAVSAVVLLPIGLLAGVGPLLTGEGAAMALWLGFGSLAVSYLLFGRGIAGVAVATATTLSLSEPLTASILGITVLEEQMTTQTLAGMLLVFAGPRSWRSGEGGEMPSEVMQALYEGRRDDAETAAASREVDVFEAASLGNHRRLASLLRADSRLAHAWSDDGFLALHYACFFGSPDCTTTLLDAGAPIDEPSRNDMGVRPINSAAAGLQPFDHVRILLARGADVDGKQTSGHTALDEARINENQEAIDLLITVGGAQG